MSIAGAREDARRIADTIRTHREELLERWIKLGRGDAAGAPRAAGLDRESFVDRIRAFITNLENALERMDPGLDASVAVRDEGALGAAIRHGEQRHAQGYSLTDVLRELGHLRVAIMELCSREGTPLTGPAGILVHAWVDHAIVLGAETIERRARDDLVSFVSHELRTPLHAILGWSQLARARPILDRTVVTALSTIDCNAQLQSRSIEDLLDLARMRNKELSLELRPLDPRSAVDAAIEELRPLAMEQDVELELATGAVLPKVAGDYDRLHQVFSSLLGKALELTPRGGRIDVIVSQVDRKVRTTIRDTGVGIAPALLPTVFEPFRHGEGTGGGKRQSGVSLAIVRELVRLHDGCVLAESAGIGQGSTFTVELPALLDTSVARTREREGRDLDRR